MQDDIQQVLGKSDRSKRFAALKYIVPALVVVAALGWWLWPSADQSLYRYQTAPVQRGDLTVTVTATGVIEPVNQVDVGTEISGRVDTVLVDFNDHVSTGQVLAQLNTDQLEAKLRQSKAALALARAQVKENEATVLETSAQLRRTKELQNRKLSTPEQVDTAQAAYDRALAGRERTKAQVTQAEAQLDADQTTLAKAVIRSPIDGIVLNRAVEPGQTVAASLQTPVLFTIAENLAQMELQVSVDEADVGMVREGQQAMFRVDAYANRSFPATISQVRFAPETVEGVVTYKTILAVDNADLSLRPGMTATAEITVQQVHDALLVPNAALRFTPPKTREQQQASFISKLIPHPPHRRDKQVHESGNDQKQVWVLQDGQPFAIGVKTSVTDGKLTEITAGDVKPGMELITDFTTLKK